ncbi:MAG: carbohydrate kinase family protein [Candidatus Nezhaarchaeales archaeon]
MQSIDVVGFGSLCIDFVFKVDRCPRKGLTNLSTASLVGFGGIIGNFLVCCSKLGLRCGVIGVIGGDRYGKTVIRCLTKAGIDTSMLLVDPKGSTAKVVCIVDRKGERTFIVDPGVQAQVKLPDVAFKYVTKCKAFHTDCLDLKQACILLRKAKQNNVTTSVDVGALAEHILQRIEKAWVYEVLNLCDVAFISKDHALRMFPGLSDVEVVGKMLECGVKVAVMTLGRKGCIIASDDKIVKVKAFKVDVVDTTGAGDAFEAGFIYSMLKGLEVEEAAIFGSAVAAIKCTRLGAQAGLPTLDQVKTFLNDRGYRSITSKL